MYVFDPIFIGHCGGHLGFSSILNAYYSVYCSKKKLPSVQFQKLVSLKIFQPYVNLVYNNISSLE